MSIKFNIMTDTVRINVHLTRQFHFFFYVNELFVFIRFVFVLKDFIIGMVTSVNFNINVVLEVYNYKFPILKFLNEMLVSV